MFFAVRSKRQVCLSLGLIVLLGGFLRLVNLDRLPVGVYSDEAAIGYNAFSILKTGRDEYGTRFPLVNLRSFGDYKAALPVYLTIPLIKLFGLNPPATRLPSALLGTLTILVTYWLACHLFKSRLVGLVAAALLAFSPWQLHVSRVMFEANICLSLFLLGVAFFIATSGTKGIAASAFFLALAAYAYHPAKLLAPLMTVLLLVWFQKTYREKVIFCLVLGTLLIPFLVNLTLGSGEGRFRETVIFRNEFVYGELFERVAWQRSISGLPPILRPIFYNIPSELGKELTRNYLKSFSIDYWYLFGEGNQRLVPGSRGMFYLWELPLLILGLAFLGTQEQRTAKFIGSWLLLAPLPAALTGMTYSLRNILLLPWPQMIEGYGTVKILPRTWTTLKRLPRWVMVLIVGGLGFSLASFLVNYYFFYSTYTASWWGYAERETVRQIQLNEDNFKQFFLQDTGGSLPIMYAFYTQIDPGVFQSSQKEILSFGEEDRQVRLEVRRFDKVVIGVIVNQLTDLSSFPEGTVLFLLPDQLKQVKPSFVIKNPSDGGVLFKGYVVGEGYQDKWRIE